MIPPDFTEYFVHARQAELRAAAARRRTARRSSLPTTRQRLGWLLVHTGLRLITDHAGQSISLPV